MGSGLTMEQGAILQHSLPLHDYPLSADHEYTDHFPAHSHHPATAYPTGGAVGHLRRDGLPLQSPASFAFPHANGAGGPRFVSDRAVAQDTQSYQTANIFPSSSTGSISTSPSSAASSLAYTNNPHAHYTNLATLPGPVPLPQSFVQGSFAGSRAPQLLDSTGPARGHLSLHTPAAFGPEGFPDTPRTVSSLNNLSLHQHPTHYPTPNMSYASQQSDCGNFPWPNLEVFAEMTCEGQSVTPEVHAKVEKGFFPSTLDQKWTCYRRNYFSVQCSFELHPNINNGRMFLKRNSHNGPEQIQAMGMRLTAAVDGSGGKSIELVQHTPKRDNGPKNKIEIIKISPTPTSGRNDHAVAGHGVYPVQMSTFLATGQVTGPYLPLQNAAEGSASPSSSSQSSQMTAQFGYSGPAAPHTPLPGQSTAHTFERVQFKQATANNGKRRASQQYFHLIVELYADVRKEADSGPSWVKVAHRVSEKIVVRGRSPSHYQNEGQNQNSRTGGSAGGSIYTAPGASYGGHSIGGFRSGTGTYSSGLSGCGSGHRPSTYGMQQHSPGESVSSSSSVDEGAMDASYHADAVMSDAERSDIQSQEGYRYYPGPIYDGMVPGGLPLPKIESGARYLTDPSKWAVKHEYPEAVPGAQWQAGSLSRFQGVETSRGYFPELAASFS